MDLTIILKNGTEVSLELRAGGVLPKINPPSSILNVVIRYMGWPRHFPEGIKKFSGGEVKIEEYYDSHDGMTVDGQIITITSKSLQGALKITKEYPSKYLDFVL